VDRIKGVENLYGSAFADGLYGSKGANVLSGGAGDDALSGLRGDDVLNGGDGNDTLDGGKGHDQMVGGVGDDTYYVDSRFDLVSEAMCEGHDRVFASVSYTLTDHVEDLTLTGAGAIDGYGNGLDNLIIGNDAANQLWGGAGNDNLQGMGGDDLLLGGAGSNTIGGGDGSDTVSYADSTVGVYIHLGLDGYQSSGHSTDTLISIENGIGGSADDIIWASSDHNVLTGGGGSDLFVFSNLGALDGDRITDLCGSDFIDLHGIDSDAGHPGVQHDLKIVGAFTHHAGEILLTYDASAHATLVQIDVTGDGQADGTLTLAGDQRSFDHFQL
jgi:Ca2+-binding RTX toxin-like protein